MGYWDVHAESRTTRIWTITQKVDLFGR